MRQLDLPDAPAYRAHLETHPDEWTNLDVFCRITISRFFRDRAVFDLLGREVLPQLAQQAADEKRRKIRVWSIGCGAGEECYSLTIQWRLLLQPCFPDCELHILGTDSDEQQLERARAACYPGNSLREMPLEWRRAAFEERDGRLCLRPDFRTGVELRQQDVRRELPEGLFHLILCRNLAFTYFEEALQREMARTIHNHLLAGGALVIGRHELVPASVADFREIKPGLGIYIKGHLPGGSLPCFR